MSQNKKQSGMEALVNTSVGFIISLAGWEYLIKPLIAANVLSVDSSITITCIFTVISVIRGYALRRWFNKRK